MGKKLAKIVNANKTNWDVKFYTTLWTYQIAYKVTTQYTPLSLFGTQHIMSIEFMVPIIFFEMYLKMKLTKQFK